MGIFPTPSKRYTMAYEVTSPALARSGLWNAGLGWGSTFGSGYYPGTTAWGTHWNGWNGATSGFGWNGAYGGLGGYGGYGYGGWPYGGYGWGGYGRRWAQPTTFAPRTTYTGVDVDGDGIPDYAVVNRAPTRTFGWPTRTVTGVDVDGDGIPDYAVVNGPRYATRGWGAYGGAWPYGGYGTGYTGYNGGLRRSLVASGWY